MAEDLSNLPLEERRKVWLQAETSYWGIFHDKTENARKEAEGEYERETNYVRQSQTGVSIEREKLAAAQMRLMSELTEVEQRLSDLGKKYDDCDVELVRMHNHRQDQRHQIAKKADMVAKHMQSFFRQKNEDETFYSQTGRQMMPPPSSAMPNAVPNAIDTALAAAFAETTKIASQAEANAQDFSRTRSPEGASLPPTERQHTVAQVVDADGWSIGWLRRVEPLNPWMKTLLELPVRRPIKIRLGRDFTPDHLAAVHERSDPKDSKWVSCMIQATGEVQAQRCHRCNKNQGVFAECVAVGKPLSQKCGNCEWNRQGCHMPQLQLPRISAPEHEDHSLVLRGQQPRLTGAAGRPRSFSDANTSWVFNGRSASRETEQTSTPREHVDVISYGRSAGRAVNGFTPANPNAQSRSLSHDFTVRNVPDEISLEHTAAISIRLRADEEICRDNLILRHNGEVYTYPPCVEGVPVAKIDENHPYWDPKWQRLESMIEPQLKKWEEKKQQALRRKQNGEASTAKFQTGRQVNRGHAILKFLEEGDISPYQLLGKKYTHVGKGSITAYDTLFRMCETLSDLSKYKLDVTPVEWLRQRLHEIMVEKGHNFNYAKTISTFYADPKLAYIRAKNGFKRIGRPSGYRMRSAGKDIDDSPKSKPQQKRKSTHSTADEASDSSNWSPSQSPRPLSDDRQSPNQDTRPLPEPKRLKSYSPPSDESLPGSASDADSRCGASLGDLDWRVDQVKTRLFTSSRKVTQYWHWQEDRRIFEHQVVSDTDAVKWQVYRDPVDFNVALDDIIQVDWNRDALQVHVIIRQVGSTVAKADGKPIGDVMAAFKRESSMTRFVGYCRQRRLKVVEIPAETMEQRWRTLTSDMAPDAPNLAV